MGTQKGGQSDSVIWMLMRFFAVVVAVASIAEARSEVGVSQSPAKDPTKQPHPIVKSKAFRGDGKRLTLETMTQSVRKMEYAVRGKVVIAADKINEDLKKRNASKKYPFDHIVYTNIGNPQSVGQKPLTWPRQVVALVDLPDEVGVNHPKIGELFPADAIRRAKQIKQALGKDGSPGAYSHSKGVKLFREDVAQFIRDRDGIYNPKLTNPEDIFLTNGASAGIGMILNLLIADNTCGVMIPIPQYPIYSATIDLLEGQKVGYSLNEAKGWALDVNELEQRLLHAQEEGINVVALVVINPGNPTGQVLTKKNLMDIVRFCAKHRLVLLADEVYQDNVYDDDREFISCKKAAYDAGLLQRNAIELVSFHSISKGVFGECGRRGGYMELCGFDEGVKDQLYKLASSNLCSTLSGQIVTSVMARGPGPTDESYESHEREKREIFESLKRRSRLVSQGLNAIPGFSCQDAKGAMYCFPSIKMPPKVIEEADRTGSTPDLIYSLSLLEETGICVVPASGFGQEAGRYGVRTTFLPPEEEMERVVESFRTHYENFCKKYE